MKNIKTLMRVKHWVKNFIVLIPICFVDLNKLKTVDIIGLLEAFIAFCLAASIIYILNDIVDRKSDRLHPHKKSRPIAGGFIKIYQAVLLMALLVGLLVYLLLTANHHNLPVIVYILINILYSLWLKSIPIIELIIVASCYILRLLSGIEALEINISFWILIAIFFVTLSIIACKRRNEIIIVEEKSSHRQVLGFYNVEFLNLVILLASIVAVNAYVLFIHDLSTGKNDSGWFEILSIPIILFGIFKYLYNVLIENKGGDPVEEILKDKSLLVVSVSFVLFLIGNSFF